MRARCALRRDPHNVLAARRVWIAVAHSPLAVLASTAPPGAAEIDVDLELVLAVDISGSVDDEYALQIFGFAEALRRKLVREIT